MVVWFAARNRRPLKQSWNNGIPSLLVWGTLVLSLIIPTRLHAAPPESSSKVESKAVALFKAGDYPGVASLFRELPPDATPSKSFLRLALLSYVR
ncbi:MAG: hypothetical protein MRJ68_01495, partial [Nitrospira sp.]|nr:hypothetical protein [Nitrospira sp.]